MASREAFLAALRRAVPRALERPDLTGLGVRFPDPPAQLCEAVKAVGGTCLRVPDRAAARDALAALPAWRDARRRASLVPEVGEGTEDPAALEDPHRLEGLEVAVLPGGPAVAENGAVWVDGAALPHRALFVIPEHLVLVVEARAVVSDLHEACALLAEHPAAYGVFVAGPSKTADIEQALVIGAQGARSCTVLLVG